MEILPETRVGELVAHHPVASRVFERHAIDFCCGGKRSLGEVCVEREIDFRRLASELAEAVDSADAEDDTDWTRESATAIARYVVERFHVPLREELPRLAAMSAKVLAAHGTRHPELAELQATLAAFSGELADHMEKEEHVLFPYIERLERVAERRLGLDASPFGSVEGPIAALMHDHEDAGRALAEMRQSTGGFVPPSDACNTLRAFYDRLGRIEIEMHRHVHLENEVLFPRAIELENQLVR
ncbi:MAG: iron-sulfur cluster repair di-iron protein [Thermoanaerobaculia bacterium]